MARRVIGEPKAGLALQIRQTPTQFSVTGRPDPALLIVVVAAAVALGFIGAAASSPREGVAAFAAFGLLFSPIVAVLVFNALRVRTRCLLDKERDLFQFDEQWYAHRVQEVHSLSEVVGVSVRPLPAGPFLAGSPWYGAFLDLETGDYLAISGIDEDAVGQNAWRLAQFVGVPLELPVPDQIARDGVSAGVVAATGVIYALPITVAVLVLAVVLDQLPGPEPTVVGLVAAVVISQIGAILAYAYYRTRRRLSW